MLANDKIECSLNTCITKKNKGTLAKLLFVSRVQPCFYRDLNDAVMIHKHQGSPTDDAHFTPMGFKRCMKYLDVYTAK